MKSSFSVGIAHFHLTKGEREKKTFTFSFKQSLDLTMVCVCERKLSFVSMDQFFFNFILFLNFTIL